MPQIHGLLTQLQSQTKRYFDLVEKGKRITETDGEMNLRQLGETICQILGFKSVMKDANTVSNWYWRYYGSKEDPGIYQKFITHSSNRKQYESQLQQELSRIDRQIETTKEQEAEWARQASAAQQRCRYAELAKPATPPRAPWRSSRSMIAAAS